MKVPRVTNPSYAHKVSHAAERGERIIEFSFPNGETGLVSFMYRGDGVAVVEVYMTDGKVRVIAPEQQP